MMAETFWIKIRLKCGEIGPEPDNEFAANPGEVAQPLDHHGVEGARRLPDVSETTRQRVKEAAEATGYTPNAAARRLRKGTTEVVMMVLPAEPGHFNEPLYIGLLASIGERLAQERYDLALIAAPPGPDELKAYRRIVEGRRADALVVVRTRRDDARVRYLSEAAFPFVVMGRTELAEPYAFVDGDGEQAFFDATRRLQAMGHRRIVHIAASASLTFSDLRRLAGYEAMMTGAGLTPDVAEAEFSQEGGLPRGAGRADPAGAAHGPAVLDGYDGDRRDAGGEEPGLAVPGDVSIMGPATCPPASTPSRRSPRWSCRWRRRGARWPRWRWPASPACAPKH